MFFSGHYLRRLPLIVLGLSWGGLALSQDAVSSSLSEINSEIQGDLLVSSEPNESSPSLMPARSSSASTEKAFEKTQDTPPPSPNPPPERIPVANKSPLDHALLPPVGTTVEKIRLPRYEGMKLSMYVTADKVKIISPTEIKGDSIFVRLYQKNGAEIEITMSDALYDTQGGWMRSYGFTQVIEPRFRVEGKDSVLDLNMKKGFIKGPVKTTFSLKSQSTL